MNNPNTLLFLMFIVVMVFFIILPQSRRNKKIKKFNESLQKGDKVVTNGGIHGKITEIKDLTVSMEISQGVIIKVDRSAINMEASELANK